MGKWKLFYVNPKVVRDALNEATELANEIHRLEKILIEKLVVIDKKRYFVRFGFRTLGGFCRHWMKFTKTQSQRLVNQVRRFPEDARHVQPTDPIMDGLYDGVYMHDQEVLRDDDEK